MEKIEISNSKILNDLAEKEFSTRVLTLYLKTDKTRADSLQKAIGNTKSLLKNIIDSTQDNDEKQILEKMTDKILSFLESNWNNLSNQTVIFSSDLQNISYITIKQSLLDKVIYENRFYLKPILSYAESKDKYLIVNTDKSGANFYTYHLGSIKKIEPPKKLWQRITGLVFAKNEEGIDKDLSGFYRKLVNDLIKNIIKIENKFNFDRLIIFAPEKMTPYIKEDIDTISKRKPVKIISGEYKNMPTKEFNELVEKSVSEIEKQVDEQELQEALRNIGASEFKNVIYGLGPTIEYLKANAVSKLFITDNISFPGYKNIETGEIYLTQPEDGKNIERVDDLLNDMVKKAIEQGATVNFIDNPDTLSQYEHILASVRFKL